MLDIFGFEIFESNSFEQLCINLCNEVMQSQFNNNIFEKEMAVYRDEDIELPSFEYKDNTPVLELLTNKREGVLAMLDEECNVPGGSWNGYVSKLDSRYGQNKHARYTTVKTRSRREFGITHYAGKVNYDPSLFLIKNAFTSFSSRFSRACLRQ